MITSITKDKRTLITKDNIRYDLPDGIISDLYESQCSDEIDDLPIINISTIDLDLFFNNMYDIKDIDTYNVCAYVASFLLIKNYYPYHFINGITSRDGLNETSYIIPEYIFRYINSYYIPMYFSDDEIREMVIYSDLYCIKRLHKKVSGCYIYSTYKLLWKYSCQLGNLRVLRWLKRKKEVPPPNIAYWAISYDQLEVFNWILRNKIKCEIENVVDVAISSGHLHLVIWLYKNNYDITNSMHCAIENGHLNIVIWLYEKGIELPNNAIDIANGHLDLIIWLYEKGCIFTIDTLKNAIRKNHLHVVQWIYSFGDIEHSLHIIDVAAEYGHLEIVKYLDSIGKICTEHAMNSAIRKGYLEIVKWLHSNKYFECSQYAIDNAKHNVLKYLSNFKYLYNLKVKFDDKDYIYIVKTNNISLIEKQLSNIKPRTLWKFTCLLGNIDLLIWLDENNISGWTKYTIDCAAKNGHLDIVKYLYDKGHTDNVMHYAKKKKHWHIVEWLES